MTFRRISETLEEDAKVKTAVALAERPHCASGGQLPTCLTFQNRCHYARA